MLHHAAASVKVFPIDLLEAFSFTFPTLTFQGAPWSVDSSLLDEQRKQENFFHHMIAFPLSPVLLIIRQVGACCKGQQGAFFTS